jgi:hypothetical protein
MSEFVALQRQLADLTLAQCLTISTESQVDILRSVAASKTCLLLAQDEDRDTVWLAKRYAARKACPDGTSALAVAAAADAAAALVVRDLLDPDDYDVLTRPVRLAGIVVHPDDKEVHDE